MGREWELKLAWGFQTFLQSVLYWIAITDYLPIESQNITARSKLGEPTLRRLIYIWSQSWLVTTLKLQPRNSSQSIALLPHAKPFYKHLKDLVVVLLDFSSTDVLLVAKHKAMDILRTIKEYFTVVPSTPPLLLIKLLKTKGSLPILFSPLIYQIFPEKRKLKA